METKEETAALQKDFLKNMNMEHTLLDNQRSQTGRLFQPLFSIIEGRRERGRKFNRIGC